jgi:hypothetical protein
MRHANRLGPLTTSELIRGGFLQTGRGRSGGGGVKSSRSGEEVVRLPVVGFLSGARLAGGRSFSTRGSRWDRVRDPAGSASGGAGGGIRTADLGDWPAWGCTAAGEGQPVSVGGAQCGHGLLHGKRTPISLERRLAFRTDRADIVLLTCYNAARTGGTSMVSNSVTAHEILAEDLAELADQPHFLASSRGKRRTRRRSFPPRSMTSATGCCSANGTATGCGRRRRWGHPTICGVRC